MEKFPDTHKYDDIIHLPHHISSKRGRMSMVDRGAQFSPFAALTGYDAAIRETARLTGSRVELTEGSKEELNEKLRWIAENLRHRPEATVTYFKPDERKLGGAYVMLTGHVKKIDPYGKAILMEDNCMIRIEDILDIAVDNPAESRL